MNYKNLVKAQDFYANQGYEFVEVPWVVPNEISKITLPPYAKRDAINCGDLVGSGEQSFLHMIHTGALKPGKYQCITPCFRDETVLSDLHRRYFMKLELIDCSQPDAKAEDLWGKHGCVHANLKICRDAWNFFSLFGEGKIDVETGNSQLSGDICGWSEKHRNWIELGSYGVRNHPLVGTWIYGTGCAEPRLSQVFPS